MTRRRISRNRRIGDERRDGDRRVIGWAPLPAERRLAERRVLYRRSGWDRREILERRRRREQGAGS